MTGIFNEISKAIDDSKNILISSHMDPDGDSIGSMIAFYNYAQKIGKNAVMLNCGDIPDKYKFFPNIEKVTDIDDYTDSNAFDLAIMLECPTPERSGGAERYFNESIRIINIDHHPDNTGFGDIVYVDKDASSVGEMITDLFINIGYPIDVDTATVLFAAILTDTGRFRFENTGSKTMEMAGKLIEYGANPREISDNIYYSFPSRILRLTGMLLAGMELYEDGKICVMTMDNDMLNGNKYKSGDTEGMAELTLYDKNVLVGVFLRELEQSKTKVSLRSRNNYNVSKLAHKYCGGGHVNASGFTAELSIEAARKQLLDDLKELVYG
jgi:phosphoesterase RecJ-like protein